MEKKISIGIAKYFFTKGIELDLDNTSCKISGDSLIYLYEDDLILTANSETKEIELHYVEPIG